MIGVLDAHGLVYCTCHIQTVEEETPSSGVAAVIEDSEEEWAEAEGQRLTEGRSCAVQGCSELAEERC